MKALTFRSATAVLTFLVGLGVTTAWGLHSRYPSVPPVALNMNHNPVNGPALEMVFVIDTTGSMGV